MATLDLVFPPLTGTNYPYLSTAALAAFVLQESDHRVRQIDLNNRCVNWLLKPDTLLAWLDEAERQLRKPSPRVLNGSEAFQYWRRAQFVSRGRALAAVVPLAVATLRDAESLRFPSEIAAADSLIAEALDAATVGYPRDHLDFTESTYRYSGSSPAELRIGLDADDGLFDPIYDQTIDAHELCADVIGISVVYRGQVYPALRLAKWLRKHRPCARILVGGPYFTAHRDRLMRHPWLFSLVDAFAIYEGERPLVGYLNGLADQRPLHETPGLVWYADSEVRQSGKPIPVDADSLPTPEFEGLPLSDYLLPRPVLPLLASRGCYWNCAFCTHHHIYGNTYRVRSGPLIAADLEKMRTRYGCEHVYFVDESMSPKLLRHISNSLLESGETIRWGSEMRMEKSLSRSDLQRAFDSGCRVLSFGVESATTRVLGLMNKGIVPESIARVLEDCAAVGIHSHAMCIIGFPGETADEARETIEFTRTFADRIDLLDFSVFCLNQNSPIDLDPNAYGVVHKRPLVEGYDFEERLAYDVTEGLDRAGAFAIWLEAVNSEHFERIRRRYGHRERERFLFSPGMPRLRESLADEQDTPLLTAIGNCAPRLVAHWYDFEAMDVASREFRLRASREYHVRGSRLSETWQELATARSYPPLRQPKYSVFLPDLWTERFLSGTMVRLLALAFDGAYDPLYVDVASAEDLAERLTRALRMEPLTLVSSEGRHGAAAALLPLWT
jgi:hypothetical protein